MANRKNVSRSAQAAKTDASGVSTVGGKIGNQSGASGSGISSTQLEQYARQMQRRQTAYGRARGQL